MNQSTIECPSCKSTKCILGSFERSDADDGFYSHFHPKDVTYFVFPPRAPVKSKDGFSACMECGCTWNFIDPEVLQKMLDKHGVRPGELPHKKSTTLHYALWVGLICLTTLVIFVSSSHNV
jgi:hypothetical protein